MSDYLMTRSNIMVTYVMDGATDEEIVRKLTRRKGVQQVKRS